jgi:osmotically-inducible protein OsmY
MKTTERTWRGPGALLALALALATPAFGAHPDAWITTKAKLALLTTDGVSATDVNVDTIDGKVTLHGKVTSAAEKAAAETSVRKIDGVTGVRNLLQVVSARKEDTVTASDAEVKERVERALAADGPLADVEVQSVNAGVVLLAGRVDTLSAHLGAVSTAADVPGVRRVASEIQSPDRLGDAEIQRDRPTTAAGDRDAGGTVSDLWITSGVKLRLLADSRTPGLDVNVDTTNGTVTLFGVVGTAEAKAAAEEDAKRVSGVKGVVNDLQVVPSAKRATVRQKDEKVEEDVKESLSRRDDLRDDRIDVDVANGVARLTGTVSSETDRLTAAVLARANGASAVRDELRVESQ